MGQKAPGHRRKRMTIMELLKLFPDNAAAERWFEEQRWPDGERHCPDCGSFNTAAVGSRKPMPYRCRDCRSHFSVRKGTVMQGSKLGLQKWAVALYMMTPGLEDTAGRKFYREVGVRQATAWFLMQRIREGFMSRRVSATVVERVASTPLQKFATDRMVETEMVYTGEAAAYNGLPREHETVNHGAGARPAA